MHWTVHLEGGPQRVNHAAVAVGSEIYSFGGYSNDEEYEVKRDIEIYVLDTETLKWTPLKYNSTGDAVPFKRYGHTVVDHGRKIYLWGGRNDISASNILHCFDVDSLTWSIPPTTGRPPLAADGHSACVVNDHMYIFGGFQDDTDKFGRSVHRLSLKTFEWEEVETYGTPPVSRDFHTASGIGNRMYIFGGRSTSEEIKNEQTKSEFYCNKIMYLSTDTMTWHAPNTVGRPPCGRRSHSTVVFGNNLYVIGGFNGITQNHLNDVHQFDPVKNQWRKVKCLGKGPCPRRRHCACVVGKHLFLFGGSSPRIGDKVPATGQDYQNLINHSDLHILEFCEDDDNFSSGSDSTAYTSELSSLSDETEFSSDEETGKTNIKMSMKAVRERLAELGAKKLTTSKNDQNQVKTTKDNKDTEKQETNASSSVEQETLSTRVRKPNSKYMNDVVLQPLRRASVEKMSASSPASTDNERRGRLEEWLTCQKTYKT